MIYFISVFYFFFSLLYSSPWIMDYSVVDLDLQGLSLCFRPVWMVCLAWEKWVSARRMLRCNDSFIPWRLGCVFDVYLKPSFCMLS
jgi:hypothetical protein